METVLLVVMAAAVEYAVGAYQYALPEVTTYYQIGVLSSGLQVVVVALTAVICTILAVRYYRGIYTSAVEEQKARGYSSVPDRVQVPMILYGIGVALLWGIVIALLLCFCYELPALLAPEGKFLLDRIIP
jgi:hypothetical protein